MIDYFANNLWQLWALVSVACLILELTNGDFFIMCFAIGAAISAITSACGIGFYGGLAIFALASVLSIFFVRPTMLKLLHKNEDTRLSNAEAIIGRLGKVSESIEENGFGRVAIDGDDWKAVSADGKPIAFGKRVKVISMDSIIITVKEV